MSGGRAVGKMQVTVCPPVSCSDDAAVTWRREPAGTTEEAP